MTPSVSMGTSHLLNRDVIKEVKGVKEVKEVKDNTYGKW